MGWRLPDVGLPELAEPAPRIAHFTGHEIAVCNIDIEPQYRALGCLRGSADILATY
jgi:hypothetical protein